MPIRRDNPFDDIQELLDRMGREFETEWAGASVSVDVADRGEAFVVTADIPGFGKDDIEVRVADSTLHIEAERESDVEEEGEYIRRERRHESASRSVRLPDPVDEAGVEATYSKGVLTVTLPKREASGGTRIEIE